MPTFLPIDPSLPSNQRRDDMDRKVGMTWLRRYFPNGLQFQKKASGIHSQPVGSAPCGLSRAFG